MHDSGTPPDELDDARARDSARMPRWVKVFAVIGLTLVVLLIVGLVAGGDHGPGRHLGSVTTTFDVEVSSGPQALRIGDAER